VTHDLAKAIDAVLERDEEAPASTFATRAWRGSTRVKDVDPEAFGQRAGRKRER
jgi:hypothetical protein